MSHRPRIDRSATTTVSHRARRASYDMLRKQYTAEASRNGGEARLLCPVSTQENPAASPGALFHLARIRRRAILLRATKGCLSAGMKISRKLKIGASPPDPPSSRLSVPLSPFTYFRHSRDADAEERVEKRLGEYVRMCIRMCMYVRKREPGACEGRTGERWDTI